MAGIFPTQIEQINDFSSKAGAQVLDVLNKAPKTNYFDIFSKMVDQATKATESQRLTEAVDAYNRAMEAGKSASEALVGLDPRVTGSKAFKDEADKIRSSIIQQTAEKRAQDMWANQLRVQGQQEEATKYASDLFAFANKAGGDNAGIWFERNKNALEQNPYAYKAVMDLAMNQKYSFAPYEAPEDGTKVTVVKPEDLQSIEGSLNHLKGRFDAKGINTLTSPEEALKLKSFDTWTEAQAKRLGYWGTSKYSDFRENMQMAYNQLRNEAGDLPVEAVLYAMQTNMDNGGLWWFDQEDINLDPAKEWLRTSAKNWYKDFNDAQTLNTILGTIKKANADNQMQKNVSAYATRAKQLKDLIATDDIIEAQANSLLSKYAAGLNSSNTDLVEAIKKAQGILYGRSL